MSEGFHPLEQMLRQDSEPIDDDIRKESSGVEKKKKKEETVIDRERKRHTIKKTTAEELPSIIVDPELESILNDESKDDTEKKNFEEQFKSKILSLRLLKDTKPFIKEWEKKNLKKGASFEHIHTPEQAVNFFTWARKEKNLNIEDNVKLYEIFNFMRDNAPLPKASENIKEAEMTLEKDEIDFSPSTEKLTRNTSESDELIKKIDSDREIKKLFEQWKDESEYVIGDSVSKEDIIQFLDWASKEKTLEISGKLYTKLDHFRFDIEHGDSKEIPKEDATIIVDPEVYEEAKINEARRAIEGLPENAEGWKPVEKDRKLELYQQRLQEVYGISLDTNGNPATPKDEAKVSNMMGLVDEDVKKIQRAGLFGKIKGFFADIGASEKDKMQAMAFKKDFQEFNKLSVELSTPKYTSGGPVSRSMVRERGYTGTGVGTVETARHQPLRREPPKKRGRPRKTQA